MLIMLLLFSFYSHASQEATEKYCFSVTSIEAARKFSGIKVPSDVVTEDGNCLVIQMRSHRRELIQRYILSEVPGATVAFSSEEIQRDPCRLRVEKENTLKAEATKIIVRPHGSLINRAETSSRAFDTMNIETLDEFQFTVNQDEILGRCRFITPKRYEISIEVRKNPRSIVQAPLPPGAVVIVSGIPPEQETMSLKTVLQLNKGERIEIGQILKDLKNKDQSVDIKPSFNIEAENENNSQKVFLSLQ